MLNSFRIPPARRGPAHPNRRPTPGPSRAHDPVHFPDSPWQPSIHCTTLLIHKTSGEKPPLLRIDPSDPRPIWRQIEESVRHLVASGALAPAALVPSVRDLA